MNALALLLMLVMAFVPKGEKPYTITYVSLKPDPRFYKVYETTIKYPVFHFEKKIVEKKINRTIRQDLLEDLAGPEEVNDRATIKALLLKASKEGLTDLIFDSVTFINDKLIAFHIDLSWIAAYMTSWSAYFVFDLDEGNRLRVTDFIKPERLADFHTLVAAKHRAEIQAFRDRSLAQLGQGEIDSGDYDYILEQTQNDCLDNFDPLDYILYKDSIEIEVKCPFAHVAQALADYRNIFLSRIELQPLLREYSDW